MFRIAIHRGVGSFLTRPARRYLRRLRLRHGKKDGIWVLYYHGIVEQKTDPLLERDFHSVGDFKSHLGFLRRFRVLSLAEMVEELASPTRDRSPKAVVTFDDGYANNLVACEMLADAGLPWSLFISTGPVGGGNPILPVELCLLILHGRAEQIEVLERRWLLKSRKEREAALEAIRRAVKFMPSLDRQEIMDCIRMHFPTGETERLLNEFPSFQALSWAQICGLQRAGVEIGSHGVNHEVLHAEQPEIVRRRELVESKAELEQRLGVPCRFFAFPHGVFNATSDNEVRDAGYELAFATGNRRVKPASNRYQLPRLDTSNPFRAFAGFFSLTPAA